MRLELLISNESQCSAITVANLVNGLQSLFTATFSVEPILIPPSSIARQPTIEEVKMYVMHLGVLKETLGDTRYILLTSRRIEGLKDMNFSPLDTFGILSDHYQDLGPEATTLWFARRVLRIGVSAMIERPCERRNCICGPNSEYIALCPSCEISLRNKGYRDGVRNLKDALNWLNQHPENEIAATDLVSVIQTGAKLALAEMYAREYEAAGKKPLLGKTILMVLHFLSDVVPFVEVLHRLGAEYKNMVLVAKPYPYSRRDNVSHALELLGVEVYRASRTLSVTEVAREVLSKIGRSVHLAESSILVIEDGGYFAPLLHQPEFEKVVEYCVGIVEQTTKGIREDEKIINPRVPILSVAQSTFKGEYESPEIGRITVQNINRFVPNMKLSGRHAIVFGFGSIGEHVAANLNRSFNMGVSVVVNDPAHLLKARHRKDIVMEAEECFSELRFKDLASLVVGTTGRERTISEQIIRELPSGCILVSTSSDRMEIDMEYLERTAGDNVAQVEEGNSEYRLSVEGGEKAVVVLADGYPINFYGSESLPNDTIDPIMTLLLLCGLEICESTAISGGIQKELVNEVTKKRGLIEKFLARC